MNEKTQTIYKNKKMHEKSFQKLVKNIFKNQPKQITHNSLVKGLSLAYIHIEEKKKINSNFYYG